MSATATSINFIFLIICTTINGEIPSPTLFIQEPSNVTVMNGESVTFNCVFDDAAPNCYWEKDEELVEIDGRYEFTGDPEHGNCSIKISPVRFGDDGIWRCGYPKTAMTQGIRSNKANLTVGVSPSDPVITFDGVAVENGSKVYLVSRDEANKLACWSEKGIPTADLRWTLNNIVLSSVKNTYPSAKHPKFKIVKSTLSTNVRLSWQQQKLYCESHHPSSLLPRTTYVRLILRQTNFQ